MKYNVIIVGADLAGLVAIAELVEAGKEEHKSLCKILWKKGKISL